MGVDEWFTSFTTFGFGDIIILSVLFLVTCRLIDQRYCNLRDKIDDLTVDLLDKVDDLKEEVRELRGEE